MLRNTTTAFALAGALTLLGAACGGDDTAGAGANGEDSNEATPAAPAEGEAAGGAEFCESAKALYDQLSTAAPGTATSPEVQAVLEEARGLEAPETIAADWTAILDTLVEPVVAGELDVEDPAGSAELTRRATELAGSLQRTGTFFDEECGFGEETADPSAVTTVAPTPAPAADAGAGTTVAPAPAPADAAPSGEG